VSELSMMPRDLREMSAIALAIEAIEVRLRWYRSRARPSWTGAAKRRRELEEAQAILVKMIRDRVPPKARKKMKP
jgi:hypothetical protein